MFVYKKLLYFIHGCSLEPRYSSPRFYLTAMAAVREILGEEGLGSRLTWVNLTTCTLIWSM